jgi:hypothetical protein
MKNSTKIILVGIAAIGIVWFIYSKRRTPIVKRKNTAPQNPAQSTAQENTAPAGSVGSTTNAGTTLTTDLNPTTSIFTDDSVAGATSAGGTGTGIQAASNPCAPKQGFTVTTYNSASNITRIKQECERAGAKWITTRTGGCCIKKNTTPIVTGPPTISSPVSIISTKSNNKSNSCFIADTLVSMSNGEKMNIQDVKVGMEVISWNEETKNQEYSKVTETIISSNTALVTIKTDSGIKITCTREHPFWVKESFGWIQAMLLERGDIVTLEDGKSETIISVETNKVTDTPVYNLHISDNHTYYANSVLVHNKNVIYTGAAAQEIVSELQQIFGYDYSYDDNPNSGYY